MNQITRLYQDLRENQNMYSDNCAILNIAGDSSENSIIPEGLYNHLCRMNRILMDRRSELQDKITNTVNEIGNPVLIETGIYKPNTSAFAGMLDFKIYIPSKFTYTGECEEELNKAIKDVIFPIIEKYIVE